MNSQFMNNPLAGAAPYPQRSVGSVHITGAGATSRYQGQALSQSQSQILSQNLGGKAGAFRKRFDSMFEDDDDDTSAAAESKEAEDSAADEEEIEGGMSKSDLLKMQKERKKVAKNNSKFRR